MSPFYFSPPWRGKGKRRRKESQIKSPSRQLARRVGGGSYMIKNYLKTAIRNLFKSKTFFAINVLGLTIGLCSCLLIVLYIQHEISYDNFEKKGDRIARVIMEYNFDGSPESNRGNYTSVRVAPVFKKNFPEVESATKMQKTERVVKYKDKLINEKNFVFADQGFFDLFSFELLQGEKKGALAMPYQVMVTESTAKKYFPNENPMGKALKIGNDSNLYQVIGVLRDCPTNSQIKFDFLASFASLGLTPDYEDTYWDANYTTYVLLTSENSIATLQAKLPAFMKKEMEGKGATVNFYLEPFRKIHLYSPYPGFEPNNNIVYIYILAAVAILILVIACSTYINLSTARSIERAKEVGVRKVIGAGKQQLFWQFIGESALLCLLSTAVSFIIAWMLLPAFNHLADKQLSPDTFILPAFYSICGCSWRGALLYSRRISCPHSYEISAGTRTKGRFQKFLIWPVAKKIFDRISIFYFRLSDRLHIHDPKAIEFYSANKIRL